MSLHPQYFKIFTKSYETIMKGDGPLPFHYRHYIAIMVILPLAKRNNPNEKQ